MYCITAVDNQVISTKFSHISNCFHGIRAFVGQRPYLLSISPLSCYTPMDSSSSASAPTFTLPNLTQFVFIKLEGPNYLPWTTQLAPILKTHELMGIVDGSEPCPPQFLLDAEGKEVLNPAYTIWQKKDQYVLSWINVHLSESVLSTIYGLQTSQQVWTSLATKFASSTRSHVSHLKRQLQTLKQGSKSCSDCLKTAIHTDL
jgi:hypothetical protein